ncbi:MAG: M56 family metallopeptidase [Lachnospiraceae bacterium]|nr:M56 family metallopeptidase [Lachnospiraceae bacterium]
MTNMFLSFLEISIPISLIIAVLLLLTPFLNKRYAAKWKYWIWIVLALRLIIPLGGNGGQPIADIQPQRETLTSSESEKTHPDALADGTARGRVIVEIPAQITTPIVTQPEKAGHSISMLDIIALVWMLGGLLLISVHLVSYFYYKHQILKKGKIVKDNDVLRLLLKLKHELHINCTVSVIEYPEAASPLLIGFCNHILVLPKGEYNSEELFFILKHELIHLKRGDIYLKLLFAVVNAVHWFNPLIWIMQKEATVDMELSCDERVTQGTDYATRKAYTETLLSTLHKQGAKKTILSTGFYGGKQIMKKRFKNILAKNGKKNGVAVLICAIMLAASLGTLVGCSITKESTEDGSGSLETEDIQDENSQTDQPSPESGLDNNEHDSNNDESVNVDESAANQQESSKLPETAESSNSENETSNMEKTDNSFSYYGTWEVKDYQSATVSALSSDDMESFRGVMIAYQSDSILLDGQNVTAEGNFTYEIDDVTYNYDSLMETYKANLGEWWNNISEVTCVTIDSNESFFGNQFFVVDSDTIWIYYEGVFFLAKNFDR